MSANGYSPVLDGQSTPHIPESPPGCCCGDSTCTFQRRTQDAFESLEQNLRTAGRLGQALLVRHEAYVAEAEQEKAKMAAQIERLTAEKASVEGKNASIIEENRSLLDQLESVNNAVSESDGHIESLSKTLQSTQDELHRLSHLASRTESLERELEQYEREHANLEASVASKTEEAKSATLRLHEAQRQMAAMEDQLGRIERDAREEREKHVEIVGRMERQRVVEKELDTAGGRLRGAAAAKTMAREKHGSTVVSHFVKDILQDNTNLQVGIVELRELLANSNEEVERLRQQLSEYSFSECPSNRENEVELLQAPTIRGIDQDHLDKQMNRASTQELHVHHHYHAPSDTSRRQSQTIRRSKKKRAGITSGTFTPSNGSRTPRSSISGQTPYTPCSSSVMYTPSSTAAILSQTSVTVPNRTSSLPRWSMHSAHTLESSIASSPQSTAYQASSLFDRGYSDPGMDSSRPTTPDSEDLGSPLFQPSHHQLKRGSAGYFRAQQGGGAFRYAGSDCLSDFDPPDEFHAEASLHVDAEMLSGGHDAIPEEDEQDLGDSSVASTHEDLSQRCSSYTDSSITDFGGRDLHSSHRARHRRVASHESLLSVSGMDIHTLRARPSQLLTGSRSFSSEPVVCAATAHAARPTLAPRASDSSRSLLSGMAADQRATSTGTSPKPTFGKKVGGWMFGRSGATPSPASSCPASTPLDDIHMQRTRERESSKTPTGTPGQPHRTRTPGINQSGPILGFGPEPQIPQVPILRTLDEEALRQSLSEF